MKASEPNSGSSSGATSTTGQAAAEKPAAPTEADFLGKEAADAKAAMNKTWDDLKHALTSTADLRQWTKQYPWIAAASATVAGFAAGYMLTPRDKEEAAEMWEKLKATLTPSGDANTVTVEPATGKVEPKPSVLGTLLREGIKAMAPLISRMVGSAVGAQAGPIADGHDGHEKVGAAEKAS